MAALLKNHQNSKLARTRNAGIGFAQTEFVLPLDADNLLLPNCLERCIALLDETAAAMAYPTLELFGDDRRLMGVYEWDPTRLQFGNYIDAMTMLRKACWAAVGGYSPLDFGWEDYDLWCKFAEVGFWGVRVPQVTARYRVHGKSMLRTCTNLAVTKARVLADITARHPWLEPLEAAQT
jgi:glycosyltransferase involved in cell wall biosynthesis